MPFHAVLGNVTAAPQLKLSWYSKNCLTRQEHNYIVGLTEKFQDINQYLAPHYSCYWLRQSMRRLGVLSRSRRRPPQISSSRAASTRADASWRNRGNNASLIQRNFLLDLWERGSSAPRWQTVLTFLRIASLFMAWWLGTEELRCSTRRVLPQEEDYVTILTTRWGWRCGSDVTTNRKVSFHRHIEKPFPSLTDKLWRPFIGLKSSCIVVEELKEYVSDSSSAAMKRCWWHLSLSLPVRTVRK